MIIPQIPHLEYRGFAVFDFQYRTVYVLRYYGIYRTLIVTKVAKTSKIKQPKKGSNCLKHENLIGFALFNTSSTVSLKSGLQLYYALLSWYKSCSQSKFIDKNLEFETHRIFHS